MLWAAFFAYNNNHSSFANDPGVGWHLKTGEWIVQNGDVPRVDPFLASSVERPWVADQWLTDLLFYSLYSVAAWQGIYLFLFVVFFSGYFLFLLSTASKYSGSTLAALFAVVLSFKTGLVHFILRPTVFGIFFFILLLSLIYRMRKSAQVKYQDLFLSFLLFLFWSNMHPSFVLGFLVLGIFAFEVLCAQPSRKHFTKTVLLIVLSGLATLLNPYGYLLHESILTLGGSEYFMRLNQEWKPLELSSGAGTLWIQICVVIILAFIMRRDFRKSVGIFALACFVIFALLPLRSVRFLPFFGVVSCPLIALSFIEIARHPFFQKFKFLRTGADVQVSEGPSLPLPSRYMLPLIILLSLSFISMGEFGPSRKYYPYDIARYLNDSSEKKYAVLASPDFGGFLSLYLEHGQPVLDDRNTLLGEEMYRRYFKALESEKELIRLMNDFDAEYYLIKAPKSGERSESRNLRKVICSPTNCLYRK